MFDYSNLNRIEKIKIAKGRAKRKLQNYSKNIDEVSLPGNNKQFIPLPFSLLDNECFRNKFMKKNRFRTYILLCRKIIRGWDPHDPTSVYDDFYQKGKLAVSIPLNRLGKELELSKSTVSDHVKQLQKDGLLKIEIVTGSDGQDYNVYLLGDCDYGIEHLFVNDVFMTGGCAEKAIR